MKERPILFSTAMVQALLEDRKTQTRRIFKGSMADLSLWMANRQSQNPNVKVKCPYGDVGDRLWVRETFFASLSSVGADSVADRPVAYKATPPAVLPSRWMPSIHMPRWACRLVLEVTDVRVERLKDITTEDAKAEGVPENMTYVPVQVGQEAMEALKAGGHTRFLERIVNPPITQDWRQGFFRLWESINGKKSLDANPWVWVVSFKVVMKEKVRG